MSLEGAPSFKGEFYVGGNWLMRLKAETLSSLQAKLFKTQLSIDYCLLLYYEFNGVHTGVLHLQIETIKLNFFCLLSLPTQF